MALLFCDSFNHYLNQSDDRMSDKYLVGGSMQQIRVAGRYDTDLTDWAAGLMNTAFGRLTYYYQFAATGTIFFAADIKTTHGTGGTFNTDSDFISCAGYDSTSSTWKEQLKVTVRADGALEIWRSTGWNLTGTLLGSTPAGTLVQDEWVRLTLKFGTSSGIWLYVDGVEVLDLNAESTTVAGSGVSGISRIGPCWQHFGNNAMVFDNLAGWDTTGSILNGLAGDLIVQANYVDATVAADVTAGAFTANTGSNLAAMLDEAPPAVSYHDRDTTYISASADAALVCKFSRFFPAGDIMGVALNIGTKASGPVDVGAIVRGLSDYDHPTAQSLVSSSNYRFVQFVYDVDPEDGAQWQPNDFVNQRWQFGARLNFGTGSARITQMVVETVQTILGMTADYSGFCS